MAVEIGLPELKMATLQLSGCSGCHISLLDLGDSLVDLLKNAKLSIKYSQILMDEKELSQKVDLLLVEGCVTTSHDEEILKTYSALADRVAAIGSCACFGGPGAIANQFGRSEVLAKMFSDSSSPRRIQIPTENLPAIHELACSIDTFAKVDFYVPGCPPEMEVLADFVDNIVNRRGSVGYVNTVCDECSRKRTGESPNQIKRIIEINEVDPEKCLVEQGIICMGKMTIGGCGAKCPRAYAPCEGCRGFSLILKEVSPSDSPQITSVLTNSDRKKNK